MMRIGVFLMALALVTTAVAEPPVLRPLPRGVLLRPIALTDAFRNVLAQRKVPAEKQANAMKQFQALDPGLQHTLLLAMDDKYAVAHGLPVRANQYWRFKDLARLLVPRIDGFFPAHGNAPSEWVIVIGSRLQSGQTIVWDGTEQSTIFYGPDTDFFPNSLCVRVPAGTPLASDHSVKVRQSATLESNTATYRCVATRGYRGAYGWQFANFSAATIGWHLYRDFFGAAAVEYSGGTHRPAAQAWYDSAYKGVGGGGNCYGMSNSSLRLRVSNMTTYHQAWFPAHPQDFCWLYPWQTETKESVQEDQGGQLSAEMAATINDYWNNQDHKEAWDRINGLVAETINRPVICFWGPNWGHAVVGYDTEISGAQHRIRMYDNNEPYAENETSSPHRSISYVDWNNSSFHANSYASANKMICLSYNECMRAPHLPTAAGGPGASTTGTVVAVVEGGQVQQVEDENGRRFYAANGAVNTDPNSRIPNAMRFIPTTMGEQPYVGPAIFIFNNSANKSLTFTVGGAGQKTLSLFQPGNVFRANFTGQGQVRLNNILAPTRSLEIPNPPGLQPSEITIIAQRPVAERVLDLQNLALGNAAVVVTPVGTGDTLDVQTGADARFSLRTETFAGGRLSQGQFRGIMVQGGRRALLTPQDWNNLGATSLQLDLRTLNNQPIQQLRINQ